MVEIEREAETRPFVPSAISLTPLEAEVVAHRLTLFTDPEFAREVFEGDDVDPDKVARFAGEFYPRVELAANRVEARAVCMVDEVAFAVLRDCLEGSTYFAGADDAVAVGQVEKSAIRRRRNAARAVAQKLRFISGGRRVNPVLSER